jgi:hypothetical protein
MKTWIACLVVGLSVASARGQFPQDERDPTKVKPVLPVAGRLMGVDFKMAKVELQGTGALVMTGGKETVFIFLPEKSAQALEGKAYAYGPQDPGPRPSVHIHVHTLMPPRAEAHSTGYTMRVEFGRVKDGKLAGRLEVVLPDDQRSSLKGSFTLDLSRP